MDEFLLPLRITLVSPPANVWFAVQRGKAELFEPTLSKGSDLSFSFIVRVKGEFGAGPPRFLGEFTQGPPAVRFVYVNSGTYGGDAGSRWSRRAKIPLTGLDWKLLKLALSKEKAILEVRIPGTGRDGGPICAGVKLADDAWKLIQL